MNFEEAIKAHSDWKLKLQRYIRHPDGSIDANQLARDNACALGAWLYTEGKAYGHLPEYKKLMEAHKAFHQEAGCIVARKDKGEDVSEETALSSSSPFTKHSTEVVSILMRLKRLVQR